MCTKVPKTTDFEVDTRGAYLQDMENCLKSFSGSMASTMNSYRQLLVSFDQIAQVYGNVASRFEPEFKTPIIAFRDGMRDMKDKGPFTAFNGDLHAGTIAITDPVRAELKRAQKALSDLKAKQKEYDAIRFKLDSIEKEYAKKDKPLESSKSYLKDQTKRDKCKVEYEHMRNTFENSVQKLKGDTERIFLQSMNNYLRSTACLCGVIQTSLNSYMTDPVDGVSKRGSTRLDQVAESTARQSVTRRNMNSVSKNGSVCPPDNTGKSPKDKTVDTPKAKKVETPKEKAVEGPKDKVLETHPDKIAKTPSEKVITALEAQPDEYPTESLPDANGLSSPHNGTKAPNPFSSAPVQEPAACNTSSKPHLPAVVATAPCEETL